MRPTDDSDELAAAGTASRHLGENPWVAGDSRAALVGRERETETLTGAMARVAAGGAWICVLEGEAGIGKTRVLEDTADHAETLGFTVVRGAGQELARDRPFGPLIDALGLGLSHLEAPVGSEGPILLPGSMAPDLRYRAVESLIQHVESLTARGPTLLLLDDLQWADLATLAAIPRLAGELSHAPLAILVAARLVPRAEELTIFLQGLEREGAVRMHLSPLTQDQLIELAESALAAPPGPNLRTMLGRTGGNPFIAHEMLDTARVEGFIEAEGAVDTARADIPDAVRLVVLQRLSRLSPQVREILRLVSILGTSFSPAELSTFLGRPASELAPVLDEAVRSGDLAPAGDRMAFRHDIVREAVYEDMPEAVRAALHLQAGRALARAGSPATTVAPHLSLGAARGDREAVEWLRRAAREALGSDPSAAAALLERAIELDPDPGLPTEVRGELLSALMWSGRHEEAIALGDELMRGGIPDPIEEARVRIALGTAFEAQARWDKAGEQFEAIDDDALPALDRALVLAQRAHLALPAGDVAAAAGTAERARALVDGRPSLALTLALHVQILVADAEARWSEIPDLVRKAEASQDGDPSGEARLWPVRQLGVLLCRADLIDESDGVLRRGIGIAEEAGIPLALHTLLAGLAWKEMYSGSLDEAGAQAETAFRIGRETGSASAAVLCLSILARTFIHRGELDRAEEALEAAIEETSKFPLQFQAHMAMWARGLLAEARNEPEAAHQALASALDLVMAVGWIGEVRDLGPDLVRIALAGGDRERAGSVASTLEGLAGREGLASLRGAALQCRGLVDADPGTMIASVEAWRGTGRSLDLARAQEDAATALGSGGGGDEARSLLEGAARGYEAAGAVRDLARCERALRSLGVRRGARGPRRRPSSGWEALTEAEARVVELAAEGLTNPQIAERLFISRHTVKTHLGHAFQKLGVSSRLQLVRAVAGGRD